LTLQVVNIDSDSDSVSEDPDYKTPESSSSEEDVEASRFSFANLATSKSRVKCPKCNMYSTSTSGCPARFCIYCAGALDPAVALEKMKESMAQDDFMFGGRSKK
jgi:hypothetical protein